MKFNRLLLCALIFVLTIKILPKEKSNSDYNLNVSMPSSASEGTGFSEERLKRIDDFLKKCIDDGMLPHAQAYVARHGKVAYHKCFGWKNIENKKELASSDIFRLASQTKAITSVALMMLYEEGLFRLDDPLSKFIPEFKNPKISNPAAPGVYSINPASFGSEITIRNLLSHTSGIPYYDYTKFDNICTGLTMEDRTLAVEIPKLASLPLDHKPGTGFTYGYGVDIIGYLIEKLSGMSLNEFFAKKIFAPLEMNDTYFYLPDDKADRLVVLYQKEFPNSKIKISDADIYQNYPVKGAKKFYSGGAGLVGTLGDYAKFCQMLLNKGIFKGHRLLSPKTIELMTTNHIGDLKVWDSGNKFGLGFEIMTEEGLKNILGSVGSYKWGGMFGTEYIIDPKEDMVLMFYCNVMPFEQKTEILDKFRNLVYQALTEE